MAPIVTATIAATAMTAAITTTTDPATVGAGNTAIIGTIGAGNAGTGTSMPTATGTAIVTNGAATTGNMTGIGAIEPCDSEFPP